MGVACSRPCELTEDERIISDQQNQDTGVIMRVDERDSETLLARNDAAEPIRPF